MVDVESSKNCPCESRSESPKKTVTFGDYAKEAMGDSGVDQPPYLPQPGDSMLGADTPAPGPIGPWATGRVDWGPLSGLTGTRPVVDHYSITRFSPAEWRQKNKDLLCAVGEDQQRSHEVEMKSRHAMRSTAVSSDKMQQQNTVELGRRAHDIHRWKTELERALEDMTLELELLESQRRRAKQAKAVLGVVRSISAECLSRRALRMEEDLVRDAVEEELIKEAALVKEVNDLIDRTIVQIEEQLDRNKAIKARLEDDWSDKKESYNIEATNVKLNNKSPTILFYPGATRMPDSQSTPEGWEDHCRELLRTMEAVKGQSCELRALLDGPILSDCVRDLRAQADTVEAALHRRVAETDLCRQAFEAQLQAVVQRQAETEKLIIDLKQAIRGLDYPLKVAQTRLNNRIARPRIESCRDFSQFGLIDEVRTTSEHTTTLKGQLSQAEQALVALHTARGDLERQLQVKLKSLYIDKERCLEVRSHYPSVTKMSGH
ncbi:tektin-4 isoform X2 [Nilaparvata lugens]|uniref:tektin-4 isoform X1 n=1 Tax=Nilaparvata lugens TaxID=108931 RepID=UPI00193D1967|nr:tektin-4 isoform X1 [Nilaparvata lugens]XP_039290684.1 tektin-4 isoform X2 [Nilaparvata lugens]